MWDMSHPEDPLLWRTGLTDDTHTDPVYQVRAVGCRLGRGVTVPFCLSWAGRSQACSGGQAGERAPTRPGLAGGHQGGGSWTAAFSVLRAPRA